MTSVIAQVVVNGLLLGGTYALVAIGLTLIFGVVRVVNMLKVTQPRPDREMEKDVVFYLKSSSLVNLDDVEYAVKDGVVTLKGAVDNLSHKYTIASDMEKIHGVKTVDVSGLTVKSPQQT